jgi:hypothetical protein
MAIYASSSTITQQTTPQIKVDPATVQQGWTLQWNDTEGYFEAASVDFTFAGTIDFTINTVAPSGGGSLVYDNSGLEFTYTPPDLSNLVALTDLGVTTSSASGSGALSYNSLTGQFDFTPPDLSGFISDYTVTEADVTAHTGALSITESQIADLQSYITADSTNTLTNKSGNISQWTNDSGYITDYTVTESDVTAHTSALALPWSQVTGAPAFLLTVGATDIQAHQGTLSIDWSQLANVPSNVTNSTAEVNDLTSAVTWANIPDANVPASAVTQHQTALAIDYSQLTNVPSGADLSTSNLTDMGNITTTSLQDNEFLVFNSGSGQWINQSTTELGLASTGDIPTNNNQLTNGAGYITDYTVTEADVTAHASALGVNWSQVTGAPSFLETVGQADVTQHQAALSITESQISDLQNYLLSVSESDVTAHQAALSITESQRSDLLNYLTSVPAQSFASLTGKPTTLAGYGITDSATAAQGALADTALQSYTVTEADVTAHQSALTITQSQISDLSSFATAAQGALADTALQSVAFGDLTSTPTTLAGYGITDSVATAAQGALADSALQSYTETNDLTGAVVWANVPDANITQSAVTQHAGALSIDYSQITGTAPTPDVSTTDLTDLGNVVVTSLQDDDVLAFDSSSGQWKNQSLTEAGLADAVHTHATTDITSGTFDDARIAETNVTQHQSALTIDYSQVTNQPAHIGSLEEDTTPQLGGNLDTNDFEIFGDGTINLTGSITSALFVGPLSGNVTGDVVGNTTGTHTGPVVGNVTGNLTGDLVDENGNVVFDASTGVLDLSSTTVSLALNDLSDVDTTTDPVQVGEVITWDGTNWTPSAGPASDLSSTSVDALSDIDITTTAPTEGQTLVWDDTANQFVPGDNAATGSIDSLSDIDITTTAPTEGQTLVWDDTANQFVPGSASTVGTLDDLTDVDTTTVAPTEAQVLAFNSITSLFAPATVASVTSVANASSGYEFTGGFTDRTTGAAGSSDIGTDVEYTQAMATAKQWLRFGFDSTRQLANDRPYWSNGAGGADEAPGAIYGADANNLPAGFTMIGSNAYPDAYQGTGLFSGKYQPGTVDSMFSFTDNTAYNSAQTSGSLLYNSATGSYNMDELNVGDYCQFRFDFNLRPQIANTTVEVGLIWQTRDANDNATFTFALTGQPIFYGQGSVGQTFLNRPTLSAYLASAEDVNARALPAIRSDNPVFVQPLTTLFTVTR